MGGTEQDVLKLMDIMRYATPELGVEEAGPQVARAIAQHTPRYLMDIYLFDGESSVCALLHPKMYARVYKGWMRIGCTVKILGTEEDMITEIEVHDSAEDLPGITAIKKEMYETMPSPLYSPRGYYIPLLSNEGYIPWDTKWKRALDAYTPEEEDQPISVTDMHSDLSETPSLDPTPPRILDSTPNTAPNTSHVEDLFKRKAKQKGRLGYTNIKHNTIKGVVLLKSRLCTFRGRKQVPLLFSFVLGTEHGAVKVYVWENSVRQFFCVQENDYVLIRGFKIKRRQGVLLLADRTLSDADTQYASLPEISVNPSHPAGVILKIPEDLAGRYPEPKPDKEFTTVSGVVEYVSSLLRWKASEFGEKKLREFVYLRVSGTPIKLFSAGKTETLLEIRAGAYVEVRHLRRATMGTYVFYLSSLYTQVFFEECRGPNADAFVLSGQPKGAGLENAVGYIPVPFKTLGEYSLALEGGLGTLSLQGTPIPKTSPNAAYLQKDTPYFGSLVSIATLKKSAEFLYTDEVERYIVPGQILGAKHRSKGDPIGKDVFDISYSTTDITLQDVEDTKVSSSFHTEPSMSFVDKTEECAVVRIGDATDYLDIQVFHNHLLRARSFAASVSAFLNTPARAVSVLQAFKEHAHRSMHFVIEAIRISEESVVYVGISCLE
ncbi:hypothetical protein NECID01_0695 [Nematocida sp. AWRm77]|nr:hypothetical protein NECID01_0695 [Nematocida sp. AWRm77]